MLVTHLKARSLLISVGSSALMYDPSNSHSNLDYHKMSQHSEKLLQISQILVSIMFYKNQIFGLIFIFEENNLISSANEVRCKDPKVVGYYSFFDNEMPRLECLARQI